MQISSLKCNHQDYKPYMEFPCFSHIISFPGPDLFADLCIEHPSLILNSQLCDLLSFICLNGRPIVNIPHPMSSVALFACSVALCALSLLHQRGRLLRFWAAPKPAHPLPTFSPFCVPGLLPLADTVVLGPCAFDIPIYNWKAAYCNYLDLSVGGFFLAVRVLCVHAQDYLQVAKN